ncbi:MAG: flagellar motor switch protein FliM [Desulfobacterales bacterium]
MGNVLSQEEVDSLLTGIGEGEVETETDAPDSPGGTVRYDFGKESDPVHLKMPTLGVINERFLHVLKPGLSNATGTMVDVSITDVDTVRYDEFCRSLPLPSSLNIFKIEPLRGFALLVLEGSLVFAFVDTFFGGSNLSPVRLEGKSFTPIEAKIIERTVSIVLENLQQAWSDVIEVKLVPTRTEIDPQFAGVALPDEMIIANRFSIDLGNFQGAMTICWPYSTLEPIREKLQETFKSEELEVDQGWRRYFENRIMSMDVDICCILGTVNITGRELLEMKVGDVMPLDQRPKDPIIIQAEGLPKFRGYMGAYNNRKAVRIHDKIGRE